MIENAMKQQMKKRFPGCFAACIAGVALLTCLPVAHGAEVEADVIFQQGAEMKSRMVGIRPGVMWKDDAGADITAHGGCVIQMGGVFYWYGENNRQPGGAFGIFTGVRCYTSTDFTNWHNLGIVLAPTESGPLSAKDGRVAYRPKVLYNQRDAQYVMILTETGAGGGHLLFATSPTPAGPFTYRGWSFGANQSKTMDMGVYQEGEKAYVVYSDNNCGISIDRLSDDYLSVRERVAHIRNSECQCGPSHPNPNYKRPEGWILKGKTRVLKGGEEGPALVKANGFYFLVTSWCSGWAPNQCHYRVSKSLEGPWNAEPDGYLGDETSFDSQSGYILTITGTKGSTFINISDRWKGGNTQEGSSYPWLPLQINGSTMTMEWYDTWHLDLENGTWSAGSQLSRFTQKEPPCGITLSIIEQREEPVIAKGMPGTEHNKYGFEGGCVLKLDGVYHLFTSEMVADPVHDKMMLAHWTSQDGLTWERRDTMFESSGSKDPQDIRSALWAPMPVYNEEEGRWNVFHVSFTPGDFGRIWRAVSSTKGRQGIHGPWVDAECILEGDPKWEGIAGCHSIFPYPVNGKWMAFYGSADHRAWWSAGLLSAERLAGPWKRETTLNPVTLSGELGTENPVVTRLKSGRYVAVFDTLKNQPQQGYGMDGHLIGYADSVDGVHWSAAKQLKVDCTKLWVTNIRTPLGLVEEDDGTFTLFYTGFQRPAAGESSKGWKQYRNVGLLKVRLTVNKE